MLHRRSYLPRPTVFLIVSLTAGAMMPSRAPGAVPESVGIRKQSANVEAIIQSLEVKAIAARGTWSTRSGQQDGPGERWDTGIGGDGTWYWRSLSEAPAPGAGLSLYSDGQDAYVLPYGTNRERGGVRIQYDTLLKGFIAAGTDYRLGHLLLDMNLMPRQFIGALGALKIMGTETVDGAEIIHLRADPHDDPVADTDPAFNAPLGRPPSAERRPVVDVYYDVTKKAIVRLTVATPETNIADVTVAAWDNFGTPDSWPSKFAGKHVNPDPKSKLAADADKPILTSVEKFTPGVDQLLAQQAKRVADCPFFLTPFNSLRTVSFYQNSLARHDDASDRGALAVMSFISLDMKEGLAQWNILAARLKDPIDRRRFEDSLMPAVAGAISSASNIKAQQEPCMGLIKLLVTKSEPAQFHEVVGGCVEGWDRLRKQPATGAAAQAITSELLKRTVREADVFALDHLVRLAESDPKDANLVDPYLTSMASEPIEKSGLAGSRQGFLLFASMRTGSITRAQRYLSSFRWSDSATQDSDKEIVSLTSRALSAADGLLRGNDATLPAAVGVFDDVGRPSAGPLPTPLVYCQYVLVNAGVDFVKTRLSDPAKPQPEALVRQTAKLPGAKVYWAKVIDAVASQNVQRPQLLSGGVAALIRAYAQAFENPKFEVVEWLRMAQSPAIAGKYLSLELSYINKALAGATTDEDRCTAIYAMGGAYAKVREYTRGAQAMEAASGLVSDATRRAKLAKDIQVFAGKAHQPGAS